MADKWTGAFVVAAVVCGGWLAQPAAAGQPEGRTAEPEAPSGHESALSSGDVAAVLDRYCVTCHNARVVDGEGAAPSPLVAQLRAVGLSLDRLDASDVAGDAGAWEAVVRKLRAGAMPPIGRPRPDEATVAGVASWLEASLDRAAAAAPDPGRRPPLHRLSRTEYANAVRDLLGLDDLPKELDISVMLPADNATSGFDNLAELLFVSPTLMERYLAAARKISRLAIGDPRCCPSSTPTRSTATWCRTVTSRGCPWAPAAARGCGPTCRSTASTSSPCSSPAPPASPTRSK